MQNYLEFEKPIEKLENKIEELKLLSRAGDISLTSEIIKLEEKSHKLLTQIYKELTPWQKTQVARHEKRPKFLDYINTIFTDFLELSGDRCFSDDKALIAGIGKISDQSVIVMGNQKGNDTETRLKHNFGMARPDGYRKAQRVMKLADRFSLPVVTFVDTSGAYPGLEAEERGAAEAIANSINVGLSLKVPSVSIVIGEGGSGGAIALASCNKIIMLEHSVYSVISPEGCASILWRDAQRASDAANALKLTAQDLYKLGIVDEIIGEPLGGAHRSHEKIKTDVKRAILKCLQNLNEKSPKEIFEQRRQKFLTIGETSI